MKLGIKAILQLQIIILKKRSKIYEQRARSGFILYTFALSFDEILSFPFFFTCSSVVKLLDSDLLSRKQFENIM